MEQNNNFFALQAVIFKKTNWTLEKAKQEVNNFIKSKNKHFYRETSSSFRFRNIPKQKFIKKTFRTKNLKNGISLVMGELKPEFHHLEGAGIFDLFKKPIKAVKQFFSPRQDFNNTTKKNLNQYGNLEIKRLTIIRTPIMNVLDKTLNLISFGKWNKLKKEYGHDKLFHLALIANLGTKNLVIEKNEVINVNTSFKMGKESETMDVDLKGKKFTVNQMLDATRQIMGEQKFYSYNGFTNNCQTFIKNCLLSMGLYDDEENKFVFQELSELAQKFPSLSKKIMNATTHLGAITNKLTGRGELKKKEITSINDLTLKQVRSLADAFNKHMQILNIKTKSKKNLVEELEHHLEIINGELQLKPHIFELMQKKKTGDIEVEVEIERLQSILDELNAEYNPIEERRIKKEAELKEEYKKKFGYDDLGKLKMNIERGVLDSSDVNKLKKEFKVDEEDIKTKDVLLKFLERNSLTNYLKKHLNYEGKEKLSNLKNQIYKTQFIMTPENIKAEKLDAEIRGLMKKQRKIEDKYKEEINKKLGENLQELAEHLNYLRFTGLKYDDANKTSKKELMELEKRLKKKFKLRSKDALYDFISKNLASHSVRDDPEWNELYLKIKELYKKARNNSLSYFYNHNLTGYGKMSLEDEFKMDEADHNKKLEKLESSNPDTDLIKGTLEGLKSITESGLQHIKKLEEMLELRGGSAKSAGFIRAVMARRKAKKEGKKTTRDENFKKFEKSGFNEKKLNKSSKNLVVNVFKDGVYKKMVLNFAILNEYYLYNTEEIRKLYEKDPENAEKAVEAVEEILGDSKKVLEALKKQVPNYDDLTETEKEIYLINYKQAVRATIMSKYFEDLGPVVVETTDEMKERMKQNYLRWYNKNKKSKKPKNKEEYDDLLDRLAELEDGEELEVPIPTKGKKETVKQLEQEVKEVKKKRKSETEPSEDRKAVDDALIEFLKRQEGAKKKEKETVEDDLEDIERLLAEFEENN